MALKKIVTKEEYEKLPEPIQKEYKKEGDDFVLDVTGIDDGAELKRAKENEVKEHGKTKKKLTDLTIELEALKEERDGMLKGSVKKDDVDRLEASYKKKLADREAELTTQISSRTSELERLLVDSRALELASKLSDSPSVILPHIKSRLKAEESEGKWTTKVLAADGSLSASTLSDLEKEIVANKEFAPILRGSKASGGGAGGGGGGGGASSSKVDFSKSPKEIAAAIQARVEADNAGR